MKYVNKKNRRRSWDTQKNIEVAEKWAQKNEEQEKKIRKNKIQVMNLEKRIHSQRLISFFLFLSASLALLASLWINNYLASFKFTYGINNNYYSIVTPGETLDFHLDCNLENNYCQSDEVKIIHLNKINTSLDQCFKYLFYYSYIIEDKHYKSTSDIAKIFPEGLNQSLKTEFRDKKIIFRYTVSNLENKLCIKNSDHFKYYKIFPMLYESTKKLIDSGISLGSARKVNPFLYGELSISNMVKRFPINYLNHYYISVLF